MTAVKGKSGQHGLTNALGTAARLRTRRRTARIHWSLPDPAALGEERAFEETADELRRRIKGLSAAIGDAA